MGSSINVGVNVQVDRQALTVLRDLSKELANFRQSVVQLRAEGGGAADVLNSLARGATAFFAALEGLRLFRAFIAEGFQFNSTIESSKLGIASLITALGDLRDAQGNLLTGTAALGAAQELAADQILKLRIAGLQTIATTQELTVAFQQGVGVGLKYKLTLDQIRQITIGVTQAAGALNVPMNQLNEEIRSLLSGNISQRNSIVATRLGITPEAVRQAQQTGKLFEFIQSKLVAFNVAGEETAKTFKGVTSNLQEAFQLFAGEATKPLFDAFKGAAQQALTGVFDIPKAEVSQSFQGILEIFQQVFAGAGSILADAINGAVKGAQDLSAFLQENKDIVQGIFAALQAIGGELIGLVKDISQVVLFFAKGAFELHGWEISLNLIALVIAGLRDGLKIIVGVLGTIGTAILALILQPFRGWLLILSKITGIFNKDLAESLQNGADAIEETLTDSSNAINAIFGEFADGNSAVQRLMANMGKFKEETKKTSTEVKKLGTTLTSKPFAPEGAGTKNDPKQFAAAATTVVQAELKKQEAALELSLAKNEISYRQYYADLDKLQIDAINKQIKIQQDLLKVTTDAGDQAVVKAQITKLETEKDTIVLENARKRADAEKKINEQVQEAQAKLFAGQGNVVAARTAELEKEYADLIAKLTKLGDTKGLAVIQNLFNTEIAKAQVDELEKQAGRVTDVLSGRVSETSALLEAHLITERDARERLTAAYKEAGQQLTQIIPLYEQAARATGDPEQIARVDALKQKLLEVNIAFKQQSDALFKLKEAALDATTSALANVFTDLASLGQQSTREIKALQSQLSGAQKELDKLLQQPATAETGSRITQLREEIKNISVELENSKDALRTWVDVFEDAARSIVRALQDVVSQMLATLIVQSALSFIGGFSRGGAVDAREAIGGVNVASGGFISGPGTGTSDSIPARLSNGEYVIRAERVRQFGTAFLDAINGSGGFSVRGRRRGFAAGGLVTAPAGADATLNAQIGLEPGLVVNQLETSKGVEAVLRVLGKNQKAIKAMLGV